MLIVLTCTWMYMYMYLDSMKVSIFNSVFLNISSVVHTFPLMQTVFCECVFLQDNRSDSDANT